MVRGRPGTRPAPMPDTRSGSRVWEIEAPRDPDVRRLPMRDSPEREPGPAILVYIPYRKNDLYAWRDALEPGDIK